MDQKEEVEEGEADVGAGCLWKHSSGAVSDFQQEPGEATHALGKSQSCECWMRAHTEGWGCYTGDQGVLHWELLVRGAGAVRGAHSITSAAHTLLQAAEKSGSGKLFQTDGRMQRGLHRLAQEQFLERQFRGCYLWVLTQKQQQINLGQLTRLLLQEPLMEAAALERDSHHDSWISSLPFIVQHRKANWHPFQFVFNSEAMADECQDLHLYNMRVMQRARWGDCMFLAPI